MYINIKSKYRENRMDYLHGGDLYDKRDRASKQSAVIT